MGRRGTQALRNMVATGLKRRKTALQEAVTSSASSQHQDKKKCPPHHYILGDPVNGIVSGYCKYCGATKSWNCEVVEAQILQCKTDLWPANPGT
jgi:hypothetical protein